MARDVDKNIPLYFYDVTSGIFTGEVGSSGDSNDFTLPVGMTPVTPPTIPDRQQAIFDIELSAWYLEWIDPYDGLSPEDQATWDAAIATQKAINNAQEKFNARVGAAIDLILAFIDIVHTDDLLPAWKDKLDSIRADYAAWIDLED